MMQGERDSVSHKSILSNAVIHNFPFAPQPDIIRATQKDAYFAHHLQSQIKSSLAQFVSTSFMMKYENWISVFSMFLYEWLTIGTGRLSLGEEYCDLKEVEAQPIHVLTQTMSPHSEHRSFSMQNAHQNGRFSSNLQEFQENCDGSHSGNTSPPMEDSRLAENVNHTLLNSRTDTPMSVTPLQKSSPQSANTHSLRSQQASPQAERNSIQLKDHSSVAMGTSNRNTSNSRQTRFHTKSGMVAPPSKSSIISVYYFLKPVSLWKRNLLLILKYFLPLFSTHFLIQIASRLGTSLNRQRIKKMIQEFHRFHLAIFYLNGIFIDASKRLLNIRYVFTGRPRADMFQFTYHILGIIILLQQIYHLYRFLKQVIIRRLSSQDLASTALIGKIEIDRDEVYTHSVLQDNSTCPLCLEQRKDTTSTSCGHLYCWDCIVDCFSTEETIKCPTCRSDVHIKSLCRVYHYDGLLKVK